MNFANDKIRTAFFGLIIASVVLVQLVRAKPSADLKPTGKEHPALRDNGNKSEGSVIDSAVTEFNDTKLERGNINILAELLSLLSSYSLLSANARKRNRRIACFVL